MTGTARLKAFRMLALGLPSVLLAFALLSLLSAAAQASASRTVAPLPASDYSVRSACAPPARGYARCAALQLVPETPAARAHSHPLGISVNAPAAGGASEVCRPPLPVEGCEGLRPQDLHGAYGLPSSPASAQTIAIVDAYDDPTAEKDLKVYDEEFGLPPCTGANGCFTKVDAAGKKKPLPEVDGEWALEIATDIEVAHATCQSPTCHILLVEAESSSYADLEAAESRAVTMGATEISNSWYGEEPAGDSAAFNHPGTVITAASGDEGFLNWDAEEEVGLVRYPASSPHVIAVGGTRLSLNSPSSTWKSEVVWNGYGAGGSGCSEHFPAAAWQWELPNWASVGCSPRRAVADISADADPYTGVAVYDSTEEAPGVTPYWTPVGGTSVGSPLIAAAFALAGGAGGVEYPARTLYENAVRVPASLHDIVSGSNGECTQRVNLEGLAPCSASEEAASCSGRAICLAGPGYDGPSGVGTPNGLGAFEAVVNPAKKTQAIEFSSVAPASAKVEGPGYAASANASSGLAVFFTSGTPSVCTVEEATVSFIASGTCTVDADQAGNAEYEAAPQARQSFAVGKGSQVITFTSSAPSAASVDGPAYIVVASASSGLGVSLASGTPSVCSLEGTTVSFTAVGTCTIDASQAGDADYGAAPEAQQSFAVGKRTRSSSSHPARPARPPSTAPTRSWRAPPRALASRSPPGHRRCARWKGRR